MASTHFSASSPKLEPENLLKETPLAVEPELELGLLPKDSIYYEVRLPRRVLVETIWQGYISDNLVRIYSGKLFPDGRTGDTEITEHGAIYITTLGKDNTVSNSLHATDEEIGALTIVDVNRQGMITLAAEKLENQVDDTVYFNVGTQKFATSLEEAALIPPESNKPDEDAYP